MRKIFTLILIISYSLHAAAQNFSWARMETGYGADEGASIVADASGNVYTTGIFESTVDFDPGAATSNLTSNGYTDIFIQKVDASGNLLWVKQIGGIGNEYAVAIDVNLSGDVYVVGKFEGTIDLDPGAGVVNAIQTDNSSSVSFLLKLNAAGDYVWGKQFGGTISNSIRINDMKLTAGGAVIAVGGCVGTSCDFDPNAGTSYLSPVYQDAFILRITSGGNFSWVQQIECAAAGVGEFPYTEIERMDFDPSGNILVIGPISATADFDPGAGIVSLTNSAATSFSNEYFIAKYTSAGAYIWAGLTGGASNVNIYSGDVATDISGNVYVISESFGGTIDFDIKATVNNLVTGNGHLCIQKLDPTGNFLWAKSWAQLGNSFNMSACTDASSNLYISSHFNGTKDFNPGAGVYNQTETSPPYSSSFNYDAFILKLDNLGNFNSAIKYGGNFSDQVNGMYIDASDNIYSTGSYKGYGDFDPGAGILNLNSNGNSEIFVQKLTNTFALDWAFGMGGQTNQVVNAVSKTMKDYVFATGSYDGSSTIRDGGYYGGSDIMIERVSTTGSLSANIRMGGDGNDRGTAIISDTFNNIYVAGCFQNTANFAASIFDPPVNRTSVGGDDLFILKINPSNDLVWVRRIGSTADEYVNAMTLDDNGNLYLTGYFEGTVDFNPNVFITNNLTSAGALDAFVLKMDTAGIYIWAKNMGGTSNDRGSDIVVDASGNVITTGRFFGTADFDPSASTSNLTSVGIADMFIQKLNSAGNFVWAKSFGSTANEYGEQIIVDSVNNVICAGRYGGVTDFDPGAGTFNLTPPNSLGEIFLLQLTTAGNFSWAKSMGGAGADEISGLNIDRFGTIYMTGNFSGTADFDPSLATYNLTSNGGRDAYIMAYRPSVASEFWARSIGGSGYDDGVGLAIDNAFNVYTFGNFASTVDFDPNGGIFNLTSLGINDIYALKLAQPILLPIELTYFSAHCESDNIKIEWQTASEFNNHHFEIERSENAIDFKTILSIPTKNGNSSQIQHYVAHDNIESKNTQLYYRLKQVDNDGQFTYSNIATTNCRYSEEQHTIVSIYPNPTKDMLNVFINSKENEKFLFKLYNLSGMLLIQEKININPTNSFIVINTNQLAAGMYLIEILDDNKSLYKNKLIKQ
ncbi:MAG: T9SS type A sorting domain-containing protein [Chitinophagales bacterium]